MLTFRQIASHSVQPFELDKLALEIAVGPGLGIQLGAQHVPLLFECVDVLVVLELPLVDIF
jgi:hypothetical protein